MLNIDINGERYITNGTTDEMDREDFGEIIRTHMGQEAYVEYKNILWDLTNPVDEDWEGIADGYRQDLNTVLEELNCLKKDLEYILESDRINRNRLKRLNIDLGGLIRSIYSNM